MPEKFIIEKTTWDELASLGYASVTDYCRFLVKEGKKLPDRIEIYRGDMLCMTIPNVAATALVEPEGSTWRQHRPTRLSKGRGRVKTSTELGG